MSENERRTGVPTYMVKQPGKQVTEPNKLSNALDK
jgi:hypothetical protein